MKTGVILARFQPIHNGHLQLISKAVQENDQVLVIIGSIDKLNARNPIPWTIRKEMVEEAIADTFLVQGHKEKITVVELLVSKYVTTHLICSLPNIFVLDLPTIIAERQSLSWQNKESKNYEIKTSYFTQRWGTAVFLLAPNLPSTTI